MKFLAQLLKIGFTQILTKLANEELKKLEAINKD